MKVQVHIDVIKNKDSAEMYRQIKKNYEHLTFG